MDKIEEIKEPAICYSVGEIELFEEFILSKGGIDKIGSRELAEWMSYKDRHFHKPRFK